MELHLPFRLLSFFPNLSHIPDTKDKMITFSKLYRFYQDLHHDADVQITKVELLWVTGYTNIYQLDMMKRWTRQKSQRSCCRFQLNKPRQTKDIYHEVSVNNINM